MKIKSKKEKVTIEVEMNETDVRVLISVLRCVGGSRKGPRGVCDGILSELQSLGIKEAGDLPGPGNFTYLPNTWKEYNNLKDPYGN